jgi:hypothetical protein
LFLSAILAAVKPEKKGFQGQQCPAPKIFLYWHAMAACKSSGRLASSKSETNNQPAKTFVKTTKAMPAFDLYCLPPTGKKTALTVFLVGQTMAA